jgi:hypothetical protein
VFFVTEESMFKLAMPLLALTLLYTADVYAAGNMKPGLWEITTQSDAMQNMPKIPPAQIERMRKMGIDVPQFQNGAIVSKVCITQEMAERNPWAQAEQGGKDCRTGTPQQQGSSYTADIICDGPDMKGKGKVKASFASSESFSTSTDFQGNAGGRPIQNHSVTSGKWLSANCGTVQPAPLPPTK